MSDSSCHIFHPQYTLQHIQIKGNILGKNRKNSKFTITWLHKRAHTFIFGDVAVFRMTRSHSFSGSDSNYHRAVINKDQLFLLDFLHIFGVHLKAKAMVL